MEKALESASAGDALMRDSVTADDVVSVAAVWTGLDVTELEATLNSNGEQ